MSKYLDVALEAVKDAEAVINKYYSPKGIDSEKKLDGSPVTIADKEAEAAIIRKIKQNFPDHSILGEESGRMDSESDYWWVIDPIDGTKNFTRGVPIFGTLLALMKGKETIVGVSNMPLLSELMYAEKSQGAFLNGEQIHVSTVSMFENIYLSTGGLNYFEKLGILNKLTSIRNDVFQLRSIGDLYNYHLVAQGKIDAAMDAYCHIYDVSPFDVIITEAGGQISELDGSKLNLNTTNCLATNGLVHAQLIDYFDISTK